MKSSPCCKSELIQDIRGMSLAGWGYVGTKYICSKCGKEYSPGDLSGDSEEGKKK